MTAKDFPGFEEPAPPAPPVTPAAAPPPLAAYAFEDDEAPAAPTRPRHPSVGAATAGPAPAVPPAPPAATPTPVRPPAPAPVPDASEDIRPGSAKDLWTCPHCGAGNKPQRTTCRSCGKSPKDAVAAPWFLRPVALGVAGAVLAAGVAGWWLTRVDLTRRPAEAATVDAAVRSKAQRSDDVTLDGRTFTPRRAFSVVGRVVGSRSHPSVSGVTTVVLALGTAAEEGTFDQVAVTFNGERTEVSGGRHAVLHVVGPIEVPPRGGYLSVAGRSGTLAEGLVVIQALDDGLVVVPNP